VRVLLVRAGALGDVLLLRKAVAALKLAGHEVGLLAPAAAAAALRGPGPSALDDSFDWDDPAFVPLFAGDAADLAAARARLGAFDACIAYTGRAEFLRAIGRLVPRVVSCPPVPAHGHAADFYAQPVRELGAHPPTLPPDLEATDAERDAAEAFITGRLPPGFVALHPGSGSPAKNWPSERFAALAADLGSEPFLLVEGPADGRAAEDLASLPGATRARRLGPRLLGALLSRAGLFVGNDSGVSHLAAAWGAPTLALFGPTDPSVWCPVGRVVKAVRSPTASMADLPLTEARSAALALREVRSGEP
jgi:ADP-heptose:LPS heptosyltransferase